MANFNIRKFLSSLDPKNSTRLQAELARITMRLVSKRFHRFSHHQGTWKDITPARKRYKAKHYPGTEHLINVASRRLESALQPGPINNGTYLPPPSQKIRVTPKQIQITIDIPYAKHVNKRRPLIDGPLRREVALTLAKHITESIRRRRFQ